MTEKPSPFAFIELPPPLHAWVSEPDLLWPVRAQLAAEFQYEWQGERQDRQAPDTVRLLLELERYLDEHPDKLAKYRQAGTELAFRCALDLAEQGLREEALARYTLALRLSPDDVNLRLHHATALHALEYRTEALAQYRWLMQHTTPSRHLRVWVLAAQIHFLRGEFADVLRLLEPLAEPLFPPDPQFWDLLSEARDRLHAAQAPAGSAPPRTDIEGDFVFFELEDAVRQALPLPAQPIPVRRGRQPQVFPPQGPVNLLAMLEELRAFVQHNPDFGALYQPLQVALAYLAGTGAAAAGAHEEALALYAIGLTADPAHLGLLSHQALALQCLGRSAEATAALEHVVALASAAGALLPLVWLTLARLRAQAGQRAAALALLEPLAAALPEERGMQDLLVLAPTEN